MVQDENQIIIELIDDGRGMKTESKFKGIGLKNMKERANTIKGTLHIESQKNKGTSLQLLLPKKYIFESENS